MNREDVWIPVVVVALVMVVILVALLFYVVVGERWKMERIERKFWEEVKGVEGLEVNRFNRWNGWGVARLLVGDRGEAVVWYGEDGLAEIDRVGEKETSFDCFRVDEAGERVEYVKSVGLEFGSGKFDRWFEVEILNLEDLVAKYDQLKKEVNNLPVADKLVVFGDASGERLVPEVRREEMKLWLEEGIECEVWAK